MLTNDTIRRYARVIDNVDEDQFGRIQIKVIPEMNGVEDGDLPWARPQNAGVSFVAEGVGKHNVPDIQSVVVVEISEDWQHFQYTDEAPAIDDWYPYAKLEDEFENDNLEDFEYPQPKFSRTTDGTIFFHNTSNGELGFQHPTGLYVVVDKDGNLFVRFVNKVIVANEDESTQLSIDGENEEIEAKTGAMSFKLAGDKCEILADEFLMSGSKFVFDGDSVEFGGAGDNAALFTPLEKVLNEIIGASVIAPSGPSSPLVGSDMAPLSAKLAPELPKIKSEVIKTD